MIAAAPDQAGKIDSMLGDGSQFHRTFGYYAHGVDDRTAVLPDGWRDRALHVAVPRRAAGTRDVVAVCPAVEDLLLSKLAAGRERDLDYVRTALGAGLAGRDTMQARVDDLPLDAERRRRVAETLRSLT